MAEAKLDNAILEHVARELGDQYTGTEITRLLSESDLEDMHFEGYTKWKRIESAFEAELAGTRSAAKILAFIETAMLPVRFINQTQRYEVLKGSLNAALEHGGYRLNDFGKIDVVESRIDRSESGISEHVPAEMDITPIWGPPSPPSSSNACFVIMPFTESLTEIYEEVVKPTAIEAGLEVKRADDVQGNGAIMTDIWNSICGAQIVIADLTERNPNVFYELGIAHTLGKETILIAQQEEHSIPFDISHIRQIRYRNDVAGGARLRRELSGVISTVLERLSTG